MSLSRIHYTSERVSPQMTEKLHSTFALLQHTPQSHPLAMVQMLIQITVAFEKHNCLVVVPS